MKKKFKWIKCEDKLPENPKTPLDENDYFVAIKNGDIIHYRVLNYVDGWNTTLKFDGTVDKTHEFKDVVAWSEIPPYEG